MFVFHFVPGNVGNGHLLVSDKTLCVCMFGSVCTKDKEDITGIQSLK